MTNHQKLFEHYKNKPKAALTYTSVRKSADGVLLNVTYPGKNYATLRFLQEYCHPIGVDTNLAQEFLNNDPRYFNKKEDVKTTWSFMLKDNERAVADQIEPLVINTKSEKTRVRRNIKSKSISGCNYQIDKKQYLRKPDVDGFVKYLSDLIRGKTCFSHNYETKKPKQDYNFTSFEYAATQYRYENLNLAETTAYLNSIQNDLQKSIRNNDELLALKSCIKILEWGGVTNGAYGVVKLFLQNILTSSILDTCNEMSKDIVCLDKFAGAIPPYQMNSSFTKIYALFSPKTFLIFDSRVSAGIGLIARDYWYLHGKGSPLPLLLAFPVLEQKGKDGPNRNPTDKSKNIVFSSVNSNKAQKHAEWNVKANWIVENALGVARNSGLTQFAGATSQADQMRAVEAALFMIGYKV
jgi:hypothetical protein